MFGELDFSAVTMGAPGGTVTEGTHTGDGRVPSALSDDALLEQFRGITVWKKGGQRAPHKPLLVLLALARVQRGESRLARYVDVEEKLGQLLVDFGPARKSTHPEYPFWRLQNDGGLWEVAERDLLLDQLGGRRRTGDVPPRLLREHGAQGGLTLEVDGVLRGRPDLVNRIASDVLAANFPDSLHEDILDAVGMPWRANVTRRRRDPRFREAVLRIYEHRCAVCG